MSHRVEELAWYSLGVASPHPAMLNVRILCFPSGLFWKLFIKIHGLVSLLSFIRAFQNVILELTFTGCENVFWKGRLWQVYSEDWLKIERSGKGVLHSHIFHWEMCSVLCSYMFLWPQFLQKLLEWALLSELSGTKSMHVGEMQLFARSISFHSL